VNTPHRKNTHQSGIPLFQNSIHGKNTRHPPLNAQITPAPTAPVPYPAHDPAAPDSRDCSAIHGFHNPTVTAPPKKNRPPVLSDRRMKNIPVAI
ncbi:MAG: hypothetical protein KBE25_12365, partial [Laribacter sp.]|nr:hypothetical protein [Laribacter sp.]MBP9610112.1 hypothetical protein [Laribacter sp.]